MNEKISFSQSIQVRNCYKAKDFKTGLRTINKLLLPSALINSNAFRNKFVGILIKIP